ncbi:MAG: DNA phosphorothioation system restriction enzyme [Jaaginema sp. PMC 1079.18]|nr:DNA phosphorothioation system restriction enzyme [Jaaginema sp. PMC 1080.18]MEC4854007.1 DNA phosphorothioation system restriction enzyme [Jaaginema sp. PMC 1079.18]MEC4867838.1 DNA phosphorothioation system restriction enzyme [Jaaginema sp. PMC 1078.18]
MTDSFSIDWERLATEFLQRSPRLRDRKSSYQVSRPYIPTLPDTIQLRDYQKQAIGRWLRHNGRGTLKMATGSGKTIIALALTVELYQKIGLQTLLVICPYRHLVTQWARECNNFNLQPILAFESVHNWQNQLSTQLYNLRVGNQKFVAILTTNSTLLSEGLQSQLKFLPAKTLIVGDEAHNLGSPQLEAALPRNLGLRLALSATPERYYDDDGTDLLLSYFGAILKPEFTLADAIASNALVRYLYYPIFVELTPTESLAYAKLTKRIGWAMSENEQIGSNPILTSLLMQRSRLIGAAANKLNALDDLMQSRRHTTHTLFYCGDGTVETPGGSQRQVTAVARLLGAKLGYRVNTYTADTPLDQREALREQFERGELQGLVAIRCLDEGVDIPAIRHAVILASTGNPRQFIQRRGRLLRPHLGKTQATLFDMIVLPPQLDRETWEVERSLLRKELKRFLEFATLAENATEARQKLLKIQEEYGL